MKKILLALIPFLTFSLSASDHALLKQKCANNDSTACYELGLPLTQGENAKVQDTLDEGMSYMRKACHNGEDRANTICSHSQPPRRNIQPEQRRGGEPRRCLHARLLLWLTACAQIDGRHEDTRSQLDCLAGRSDPRGHARGRSCRDDERGAGKAKHPVVAIICK